METAITQNEFDKKLSLALNSFKLSNIEKLLEGILENKEFEKNLNYIGDLNKNDAMF